MSESCMNLRHWRAKLVYPEAGGANPFSFNPSQYREVGDGVFVTRNSPVGAMLEEKPPQDSFMIWKNRLQGTFDEYVTGSNVHVRNSSSLVKQNWPHNSNELRDEEA